MEWLNKNYDRVILLVVALVTVGLSLGLMLKSFAFSENFRLDDVPRKDVLPENRVDDVEAAIATLEIASVIKAPDVNNKQPRLFMTFPIIEKDGEIYDMSENVKLLRPPVDNTWLVDHGLDFLHGNVLGLDGDKDGFTNLEEWEEKTGPSDSASSPPILKKLYFVRREQENYVIEFSAKPDGATFQIARRLPNPTSKFYKLADTFFPDDQRFTIESFEEDSQVVPNSGITRDISRLNIRDSVTGAQIALTYRQKLNLPTYFAVLVFTLGGDEEFRVKQGEVFTLPGWEEPYKVIDIQEETAIIATVPAPGQPEEKYTLPKKAGP
jgi:hypothetical protein